MSCKTCKEASASCQVLLADAQGAPVTETQANFIDCLIPALFAAMPVFLEHLMACLTGGATGGYKPGDRDRC